MDRAEYQRLRRQLDEELRAGIEMLQAGHRAKVEILDARWREAEEDFQAQPSMPPEPSVPAPEEPILPAAEPPRRRKEGELLADVQAALQRLGPDFLKRDLCQALGYQPNRSSLHRVLWELQMANVIAIHTYGEGGRPTRYQKLDKNVQA